MKSRFLITALFAALGAASSSAQEAPAPVIADGAEVSVDLTVTLEDGTEVQSTVGKEPVVYTHGRNELLPALEQALEGMAVEQTRTVTVPPERGYGKVDPNMVVEVDAAQIPEQSRRPEAVLRATDPSGRERFVRVREVKAGKVVLDFNHPLAGHTLNFLVRVRGIRNAAGP